MTEEVVIYVEGARRSILCGVCGKPVSLVGDGESEAGCLDCGNIAPVEEVATVSKAFAEAMLDPLRLDGARPGNTPTSEEQYRFKVAM